MAEVAPRSQKLKIAANIARFVMGAVFIISGLSKVIDPWGTAIKVDEYILIYGLETLAPYSMILAIWICGAELLMGCMLTFKVRIRFVSIFALFSMTMFTIITFLSATYLPVEDCGCFGEVIKLTPWQTFTKNLLIMPLAILIWWRYRPDKIFSFKKIELLLATTFFCLSMGLGVYCYLHLPLIDFLPYKVGVNIAKEIDSVESVGAIEYETILVYRNIKSGKLKEFKLTDKAWQNSDKWEWVETKSIGDTPTIRAIISEFALRDSYGEICTQEILSANGVTNMLFITDLQRVNDHCRGRMSVLIQEAKENGDKVICITPDHIRAVDWIGDMEMYNIDPTTMKTVLRAENGLVKIEDGVIVRKANCRDI